MSIAYIDVFFIILSSVFHLILEDIDYHLNLRICIVLEKSLKNVD